MIVAKGKQMAGYREGARNLGKIFYVGNISCSESLQPVEYTRLRRSGTGDLTFQSMKAMASASGSHKVYPACPRASCEIYSSIVARIDFVKVVVSHGK